MLVAYPSSHESAHVCLDNCHSSQACVWWFFSGDFINLERQSLSCAQALVAGTLLSSNQTNRSIAAATCGGGSICLTHLQPRFVTLYQSLSKSSRQYVTHILTKMTKVSRVLPDQMLRKRPKAQTACDKRKTHCDTSPSLETGELHCSTVASRSTS